tara:strand:- start:40 stop:297 length:258 start_codon:yes stop_codon:yes gene_type:complete
MASISPENPPIVNNATKAIENNIGVSKLIEPLNMVATQLNTFTPVGIAINIVEYIKNNCPASGIPTVNIWCAQTTKDKMAIEAIA